MSLIQTLGIPFVRPSSRDFVVRLVRDAAHQRREAQKSCRADVLQMLIDARHDDGAALSEQEMASQVMLFLLAGFDSTSNLLCFSLYLLTRHPEVQQRLQRELDQRLPKASCGQVTYDDLMGCKYLDMVIAESLRLFPPVPVLDRRCVHPDTRLPRLHPDDLLAVPVQGLHSDATFFPSPDQFRPERFERPQDVPAGAYVPFGAGPRACIAKRFALMESKVALCALLSRFSLQPVDKTPTTIKLTTRGLNMTIDGGFWIGLRPRVTSSVAKERRAV